MDEPCLAPDVRDDDDGDGPSALGQFVDAFVMAELARMRPMEITMGPVTTGGRSVTAWANTLNSADNTRYESPAPRQAAYGESASPFGAMAA